MSDNIRNLKGIGQKKEELLSSFGIRTLEDLIRHIPLSYEIIPQIKENVDECLESDKALLRVNVKSVSSPHTIRKNLNITKVRFMDESHIINGVFFNKPYIRTNLKIDEEYILYGKFQKENNSYKVINPKYCIKDDNPYLREGILPIYTSIKGFSDKECSRCVKEAFSLVDIKDNIPQFLKDECCLISLKDAYKMLHFPKNTKEIALGERRMNFDDFIGFHLCMLNNKYFFKSDKSPLFDIKDDIEFMRGIPYELTLGQKKAIEDIKKDMNSPYQMKRLVQGDVGCGKTTVALYALYQCVKNRYQGVLLAPTQVLAKQHYDKLYAFFNKLGFNVVIITSSLTKKERDKATEDIKTGKADIIIGTHSTFSKDVQYKNLGLVVIDEQHRFGVRHRFDLENKGIFPNVLVMSATPIPRTLALALYSDLDLTVIEDKPLNRKKIKTYLRNYTYEKRIYDFISNEISKGRQAYIVCPSISSEDYAAAEEVYEKVKNEFLNKYKAALIHGKLKEDEKDRIMTDFKNGKIDVIVSTTIIEVGIDVANANVMLIHDAHRFGLSQLHQLRGRVGRGDNESYCILLSDTKSEAGLKRLKALVKSDDGFFLAKYDLQNRGSGDLAGFRQSGIGNFNYYNIMENDELFIQAEKKAKEIFNDKQSKAYINDCLSRYKEKTYGISFD